MVLYVQTTYYSCRAGDIAEMQLRRACRVQTHPRAGHDTTLTGFGIINNGLDRFHAGSAEAVDCFYLRIWKNRQLNQDSDLRSEKHGFDRHSEVPSWTSPPRCRHCLALWLPSAFLRLCPLDYSLLSRLYSSSNPPHFLVEVHHELALSAITCTYKIGEDST